MDFGGQPPVRGRPPSLSLDRIVDAAVACVARNGLDALTIRAVAAEAGSSPMALYRHVADRDELVARTVDRILGMAELPPHPRRAGERGPWLTAMAATVHRVLVGHPGVAEHLLVMGPTGEQGFAVMDQICHVLADTGREPEQVASTYLWLMVTVAAYAARHTRADALAGLAGIERPALRHLFVQRTSPFAERFPYLAAVAGRFSIEPEQNFTEAIEHVVDEIVRPRRKN